MQQKLAVASVLILALLAGASAVMIETHAMTQNSTPASNSQHNLSTSTSTVSVSTNSTSTTTSSSGLLTSPPPNTGHEDDGNETESEIGQASNSTTHFDD